MSERPPIARPREFVEYVDGVPVFASDIEQEIKRAADRERVASGSKKKYPKEYSGLEEQPLPSEQEDNSLAVNGARRFKRGRKSKYV